MANLCGNLDNPPVEGISSKFLKYFIHVKLRFFFMDTFFPNESSAVFIT